MHTTLTHLEELQSEYSDFYKELHGFRPRFVGLTEADLEAEIDRLHEESKAIYAQRKVEKEAATARFEALVTATIATGAGDRETAIRWIHQAEGTDGDNDYLCYRFGLSYGYLTK